MFVISLSNRQSNSSSNRSSNSSSLSVGLPGSLTGARPKKMHLRITIPGRRLESPVIHTLFFYFLCVLDYAPFWQSAVCPASDIKLLISLCFGPFLLNFHLICYFFNSNGGLLRQIPILHLYWYAIGVRWVLGRQVILLYDLLFYFFLILVYQNYVECKLWFQLMRFPNRLYLPKPEFFCRIDLFEMNWHMLWVICSNKQ